MLTGIYSAATAMQRAQQRHEVVARNLAHVNVPGYRRAMLPQQTFEASLSAARQQRAAFDSLGTHSDGVQFDFSSGLMKQTGRPLDVAIQGEGFFAVQGPQGELYTRSGAFQVNSEGRIVTSDGLPVAAESGDLRLPPDSSPSQLLIKQDGTATVNGASIGRLKVVQFEDPSQLQLRGATLFAVPVDVSPESSDAVIVQGTRELSNVNAVTELVSMISAQREHDAAQRAMNSIAEAIEHHTDLN